MNYYKDLRDHIKALEAKGKLVRVTRPINKDTQMHPLVRLQFRGLPEEERKAWFFEKVYDSKGKKYDMPECSALLIDATRKWDYPPVSLPKKEYMEEALRLWQEMGLPQVRVQEPWFGYNLGNWTEEEEEQAKWAVMGEHYRTGEWMAQKRQKA